jgi:hypothetical protein
MDIITRRFIAIGNRIASEIGLLRTDVQQLDRTVHDTKEAQNQQQQQEPQVLRAELKVPAAEEREASKYRKKQHKVQVLIALGTWLAVLAASIYGGVAYEQWQETANQTTTLGITGNEARTNAAKQFASIQKQFRREQRAWIKIDNPSVNMRLGDPVEETLVVTNIGKTAAVAVTGNFAFEYLQKGELPTFDYRRRGRTYGEMATGFLFPNVPAPSEIAYYGPHAPGEGASVVRVSPGMIATVNTGEMYLVIHGKIKYDDIFGVHHWITFCAPTTSKIPVMAFGIPSFYKPCLAYDKMDANDE